MFRCGTAAGNEIAVRLLHGVVTQRLSLEILSSNTLFYWKYLTEIKNNPVVQFYGHS